MQKPSLPLFEITYGSKLYGTSTADSDTDLKVVYLPELNGVLLGKKASIFKLRYDATGKEITDEHAIMPPDGVEIEYFPLVTFARDFLAGQTYAVEMAHAYQYRLNDPEFVESQEPTVINFMTSLVTIFKTREVYSMVGFAIKQTMDYVSRGERLNAAVEVRNVLEDILDRYADPKRLTVRFDEIHTGETLLDEITRRTGLKIGSSDGGNKPLRTLELNGRSYLETTAISHALGAINKLIKSYGERSAKAAETEVDFKSLSHAVRVYQQAIELLDTGKLTFPRPNADELLAIKQGRANMEEVKTLLKSLDAEVQAKILTSTVPPKTEELVQKLDQFILDLQYELYYLVS